MRPNDCNENIKLPALGYSDTIPFHTYLTVIRMHASNRPSPKPESANAHISKQLLEMQETDSLPAWPQVPPGYSVTCDKDGKYRWESILSPESHQCYGFMTYEEALTHCREAQLPYHDYR
jgi:hypothetical protein